jgi:hypothetical protein
MDQSNDQPTLSLRAAELAYGEAQRAADRLSDGLNDFRSRAATVFTVGVLATTFFGQAIVPDLRFISWVAICVFVLGVAGIGIAILLPVKGKFAFGLSADGILEKTDPAATDAEVVGKAARNLMKTITKTATHMDNLTLLLQLQCGALAIEIGLWTIDLAGR